MIKFFKKEKNFIKEQEDFWLNINFYWKLAVLVMFVVVFISFSFGYYFFMQIDQEPILETSGASVQVGTINKERIDKVLEYFSIRNQKSDQILNSPAPVVDPSL